LLGDRTGDNNQVLALAEALGEPFEAKRLRYTMRRFATMRWMGPSLAAVAPACRSVLAPPWPRLVIGVGRRSLPVARWIKQQSAGRCRIVQLGSPRQDPAAVDLVITTPQYPVANAPNVHLFPIALGRAGPAGEAADGLGPYPSPRRLLLIGGNSLFWRLEPNDVAAAIETLDSKGSGSILVLASRRTSHAVREAADRAVAAATLPAAVPEGRGWPGYASLLAAADEVHVTADSVSMISEAVSTGKPVGLVPVALTFWGGVWLALWDRFRPGRPVFPRDLRFFWRELKRCGLAGTVAQPRAGEAPHVLEEAVRLVRPLL
jgi:mitochondrial fission protein ELM1